MSTLWAITYDYPATVTKDDNVDDPAGPFAGLLVSAAGNVVVFPVNGPQRSTGMTIAVVAGQYITFPIKRVGSTNTTATVIGLVGAIVKTGPVHS